MEKIYNLGQKLFLDPPIVPYRPEDAHDILGTFK
jgi:hypothetical protein